MNCYVLIYGCVSFSNNINKYKAQYLRSLSPRYEIDIHSNHIEIVIARHRCKLKKEKEKLQN